MEVVETLLEVEETLLEVDAFMEGDAFMEVNDLEALKQKNGVKITLFFQPKLFLLKNKNCWTKYKNCLTY